jgi:small subunit ribosomal protein S25e
MLHDALNGPLILCELQFGISSRYGKSLYAACIECPNVCLQPPKKEQKSKEAKALAAMSSSRSKQKKKKWAKGRVKDKKNNAVVFTKALWDRVVKEVPRQKKITISDICDKFLINGALARKALKTLEEEGRIKRIVHHSSFLLYTKPEKAE